MPRDRALKIRIKNILTGTAVGLGLLFLTLSVLYYIFIFFPKQETQKRQKAIEEIERLFWEYKKSPIMGDKDD